MRIALTKLTDERHRLSVVRDDGSHESVELETRSLLLHDLVHYAVEAEARIPDGFWGLLAGGTTLGELGDRTVQYPMSPGIGVAETLVGPMQSMWQGRLDEARYVELAAGGMGARAAVAIDADFVARVRERLRALTGHWRATPFRGVMELSWPPAAAVAAAVE